MSGELIDLLHSTNASRPVLTTAGKGPIRGSLIMGRDLDAAQVKRLGEKTHLSVTLLRLNDSRVPPDLLTARPPVSGQAPILVRPLNPETVAGYALLRDIYGKPVLALGVDIPREIYRRGQTSVLYFLVSLAVVGFVFGVVTLVLLEKVILSRLTGLGAGVTRIGESTDLSARVSLSGRDELSSLAGAINRMLEALEGSQQQRRESEERFQTVGRATNDAVWDWNLVTNVIGWSEGVERLFGYPKEAIGSDPGWWQDHIHPDDRERVVSGIHGAIDSGGENWSDECRYRRADGSYAHVYDRGYVIHGEMGKPVRMIGAMMDITERKRAEEMLRRSHEELEARVHERTAELRELNETLKTEIAQRKRTEEDLLQAKEGAEAASRAKSEFLANMSHEIRTPMNGIMGMTELVLDTELTSEQREYLGMVKGSADSLLTVINDILDFSKIEAGKLDLDSITFNLTDTVEETARVFAHRAAQKGVELVCDVRADVPELVIGDPTRLRQILVNVLGNALKFTEQGEVVLGVEAGSCGPDSSTLHFSIRDTGIGIPLNKQRVIFEAFSQADGSTSRKFGGTGLGLTISARLVEMMGGRIWVESEVGHGSTFYFTARFGTGCAAAPLIQADAEGSKGHARFGGG